MLGFLFAVIAGAVMSVQGVMNTRLQENIGLWEANAFVQGTAFVLSLAVMWIFGKGQFDGGPMVEPAGRRTGTGHYRYGDAVHQGSEPDHCHFDDFDRPAAGSGGDRLFRLDGAGKNEFRLAAVDRGGADAHGCFIYEVEMNHNGIL